MKFILAILLIIVTNMHIRAEETTAAEQSTWKGDVQFGYVMSSGNTESTNLNSKFNIEHTYADWNQLMSLVAFSSSDNNQTTAERYKLEYQANKKYKDSSYLFVNTTYEDDRFSGFDYRSTLTAGYGMKIYSENNMTLDTEAGVGLRQSKLSADPVTGDSPSDSEAMVRLAAKYHWKMEENRSLISDLTIEVGEETTISNFEVGFVTMIAGDLSLKASYAARYTSEVPVDKENLDTITSINLLYAF